MRRGVSGGVRGPSLASSGHSGRWLAQADRWHPAPQKCSFRHPPQPILLPLPIPSSTSVLTAAFEALLLSEEIGTDVLKAARGDNPLQRILAQSMAQNIPTDSSFITDSLSFHLYDQKCFARRFPLCKSPKEGSAQFCRSGMASIARFQFSLRRRYPTFIHRF